MRWYAAGLQRRRRVARALFGSDAGRASAPFPGFYAPSGYFVVLLEVFAILMFACAVAAEHLGTVFERMYAHVATARAEAERGAGAVDDAHRAAAACLRCWSMPTRRRSSAPARSVAPSFCELDTEVSGQRSVRGDPLLLPRSGAGADRGLRWHAPLAMIRVGDEMRVTEVRVQHVAQKGRRFALVLITDTTEAFIRRAALEAADHAALIVDAHGRVLGFNRQATALFPDAEVGRAKRRRARAQRACRATGGSRSSLASDAC